MNIVKALTVILETSESKENKIGFELWEIDLSVDQDEYKKITHKKSMFSLIDRLKRNISKKRQNDKYNFVKKSLFWEKYILNNAEKCISANYSIKKSACSDNLACLSIFKILKIAEDFLANYKNEWKFLKFNSFF